MLPVLKHLPNLKYFVLSCLVLITRNVHNKIVSGEIKQSAHIFKVDNLFKAYIESLMDQRKFQATRKLNICFTGL